MKDIYWPKEFGKVLGKAVVTLQKWDRKGIRRACRTTTNRRYYNHEQFLQVIGQKAFEQISIRYCRISGSGQKGDLASQKRAVEQFCIATGKAVAEKIEDVGSGLNYKREGFIRLMEMVERGEVSEIVIAQKDRLVRFGFEWFQKFCSDHGCRITVMNAESLSPEAEMTKDLLSIIHGFSGRLYGLRKYKKKLHAMIVEKDPANNQTT